MTPSEASSHPEHAAKNKKRMESTSNVLLEPLAAVSIRSLTCLPGFFLALQIDTWSLHVAASSWQAGIQVGKGLVALRTPLECLLFHFLLRFLLPLGFQPW